MEKQFVPYELSVKLKELGFKERCIGLWYWREDLFFLGEEEFYIRDTPYFEVTEHHVLAPLWQQAFDWLREKHNLYYSILPLGYNANAIQVGPLGKLLSYGNNYNYEEARLACLEKLIEIVKNENKS